MPAVFVHGVPDTPRVWRPVLERLRRDDVVTLSLPGFGCPRPDGFDASKEAYVEWLLGELRGIEPPIDCVGHDWGAMLVVRAVSLEPGRVRSWAAGGGPIDAEYEWHEAAKLWQTPGVGEQLMQGLAPDALAGALASAGVPEPFAAEAAEQVDDEMKRSILALYRSAVRVGAEWQPDLSRITAPGLVLWGAEDPYVDVRFGARLAERVGARFVRFDGCSHWWPLERPQQVCAELQAHWSSLG